MPMNERLWGARRRLDWTQQQLADAADMDQTDISRIERGWIPPQDIQERLAKALKVPVETLFPPVHDLAS